MCVVCVGVACCSLQPPRPPPPGCGNLEIWGKGKKACARILYARRALRAVGSGSAGAPADPAFFVPADPAKVIQLLLELDSMERLVVDLVQHAPDHVHPGVPVLAAL